MIVAYCACPHVASNRVVNTLKRYGYKHTAILDEGILVWTARGIRCSRGRTNAIPKKEKKKK
jgi:rhodanese-related sulfurtransferase